MWVVKLILFILSILGILTLALAWSPLWNNRHRLSKKQKLISIISLLSVFLVSFLIKDQPVYERGQCFTSVIKNEVEEEWQNKENLEIVEYVVLKVGRKNYLVHSSQARNEDFAISKDVFTSASDCSVLYKRQ